MTRYELSRVLIVGSNRRELNPDTSTVEVRQELVLQRQFSPTELTNPIHCDDSSFCATPSPLVDKRGRGPLYLLIDQGHESGFLA